MVCAAFGQGNVVELIPNGSNTAVTEHNRYKYIFLLANYRLNVNIKSQSDAFLRGFHSIIPVSWIHMFNEVWRLYIRTARSVFLRQSNSPDNCGVSVERAAVPDFRRSRHN
jgi:hypothetical protein